MRDMRAGRLRALLITAPLVALLTAVMGTVSLFVSLFESTGRSAHRVARAWARMLLRVSGVKVSIEGLEKLSAGASYVIASNHLSLMDTPLVIAYLPLQFRFLAKRGLFRIPFIGTHLKRAGHIAVPREDPRASVRTLAEAARVIRERGASILVFPEGGRSPGELLEFKEGAAYIAIKAGVPLVPMSISGTREVLPMGSVTIRPGRVDVRIGDPIPTAGMLLHDRRKLTAIARERIGALLGEEAGSRAFEDISTRGE
jgi:1-acyl-sn-glycerol-3-phosphate acyltransferase